MDCGSCDVPTVTMVEKTEPVAVSLTISELGEVMLKEAFGEDTHMALLVGVLSGGCSGFMYDLQIVEGSVPDCQELSVNGIRVLVPNAASHLLNGIEIDYQDKLMGGGFKINNPNATASCGCGESFS